MSQVPQVFQETGVLQEPLDSDLRGLRERKVSKVSQEDLEVPVHQVLRVSQACLWLRKAYQDPEDWMENPDCLVHQESQVHPDRMGSPVYQERRVSLDSQASDFQDLQELKDSQVFLASLELPEDQADQEWTDFPASLDYPDKRVSLASASLARPVYLVYLDLKGSRDQKEILVSLVVLVVLDEVDLMAPQELKVSLVYLVYLEPVALLDPLSWARWDHLAHLERLAQWDHQDSPEQTERRETPVLLV